MHRAPAAGRDNEHTDIDAALHGWQDWAMIGDGAVNLAEIRRRIRAAGPD
jgi:sugar phosphate isomerase/epimerase